MGIEVIQCEAVVLDLDGVLVISEPVTTAAWKAWAEKQQIPWDGFVDEVHGRPVDDVIREKWPHLDAVVEARWFDEVVISNSHLVTPVPGAVSLTRQLPETQWAVATSAPQQVAEGRLLAAGVGLPKTFVALEHYEKPKPAPDAYARAAECLEAEPKDCIAVEDAPAGIQSARSAGMTVVGVPTTHDPSKLDADYLVKDLTCVTVSIQNGLQLTLRTLELGIDR